VRQRALGSTGLQMSEVGYGAWGIGGTRRLGADDRESLEARSSGPAPITSGTGPRSR
jgi:aryl-alcohol dehydrogenase-like predicted oxidoreductase